MVGTPGRRGIGDKNIYICDNVVRRGVLADGTRQKDNTQNKCASAALKKIRGREYNSTTGKTIIEAQNWWACIDVFKG